MELFLNLAWIGLAALTFCLWLRFAPDAGANRRIQFVALAVLLLIVFPVISVTDDIQAFQNPAETDCCQRRDHACSAPHSILPHGPALIVPALAELPFGFLPVAAPGALQTPVFHHPALAPIQNRPPPAA
jgi:hypothetical protein